jgi:hypothetical protein
MPPRYHRRPTPLRVDRRGGRPRLPIPETRRTRLKINLTDLEHSHLTARAERAGLSPALLARSLSLYGEIRVSPVPRVNYAAVGQLTRIGVLLNQLVRRLHGADTAGLRDELLEELGTVLRENLALVAKLRQELVDRSEACP